MKYASLLRQEPGPATNTDRHRQFGWYSAAWAGWAAAFAVIEGAGVQANKRGGQADSEHRTLTENIRFLAATDRDGQHSRLRVWRRIALLTGLSWLAAHMTTNGGFV